MLPKCLIVALLTVCLTTKADDINWSSCKKIESRYNHGPPTGETETLISLLDNQYSHITKRLVDGKLQFLSMQLGVQADYTVRILLSHENHLSGFYFIMTVSERVVSVQTSLMYDHLYITNNRTSTVMSRTKPSPIHVTIDNGTLEVRYVASDSPLLQHHDERFRDVKYLGAQSTLFNGGAATLFYDC